jgi:hypothetical protein
MLGGGVAGGAPAGAGDSPCLCLDVDVSGEADAIRAAEQSRDEADRENRLGLVPTPGTGFLNHAAEWLARGKKHYLEHEYVTHLPAQSCLGQANQSRQAWLGFPACAYVCAPDAGALAFTDDSPWCRYENALVELNNSVAIGQRGVVGHAQHERLPRVGGVCSSETVSAEPGHDASHRLDYTGLLLDAFWWRAKCWRGVGAVEAAVADLDRLLGWHRDPSGEDHADIRRRAVRLRCERAEVRLPSRARARARVLGPWTGVLPPSLPACLPSGAPL